jgi:DNA-binding NarL/FixJ family response regulator
VEDDEDIRAHLGQLIGGSPDLELAGQYESGEEAVGALPSAVPDVVLMDIHLPGMSGIECVRRLKTLLPSTQFLMLTVYEDSELIFGSLKAGATGYLLKRTPGPRLIEAIREVYRGGSPMSSHIARRVVQFFNDRTHTLPQSDGLTPREREVLDSLARGRLYKEIAEDLSISIDTVRKHLQNVYQKLHVHSRTEAVVKYLQQSPASSDPQS